MTEKCIKGVVFDLDGTLYSLRGGKLRITLALWRDLKILRHLSKVRSWIRTQSFNDSSAFYEAFFNELGRRARVAPDRAAEWYEKRFLNKFVEMLAKRARVRPGLLDLLGLLRRRRVKLGVVSDYERVPERLAALGIPLEAFDDAHCAEDHGVLKPSPVPLNALAHKWGVEPEALIVVGDRQDMDAASAKAAGMEFLGVCDQLGTTNAEQRFVNWPEVVRVLEVRTSSTGEAGM
ncbi:MAG: HAD family hydrolase [Proteobacteria bacterium]|nr:HAD family hydrolase [Pseudomonadota bacterium]